MALGTIRIGEDSPDSIGIPRVGDSGHFQVTGYFEKSTAMGVEEFRHFSQSVVDFLIDLARWESYETSGEVGNEGLKSEAIFELTTKTSLEFKDTAHSNQPGT